MKKKFWKPRINFLKLSIVIGSFAVLLFIFNYYINASYSSIKNNFFTYFNQCNFEKAESEISDNNFILSVKKDIFLSDLENYFTGIVDILCTDIQDGNITSDDALPVLHEIQSYNVLNSSIDKLLVALDSDFKANSSSDYKAIISLGVDNYTNGNYTKALELFNKVDTNSAEDYALALKEITNCKEHYISDLISQATLLANDDYYTKAIDLLSNVDTNIISSDDPAIISAISTFKYDREEYLASLEQDDYTVTNSSSLLENLTHNTVNTLDIDSSTSRLIYVDLTDQMTYVFTGYTNNWTLEKSFTCSTGIPSKPTPTGIYDVTNKGAWFFSEKFQQGGKYWVQFLGDYLFHSVPYDETQTEILDTTLGEPASHGCIRLATEDAKWLYDNISTSTKVIIK